MLEHYLLNKRKHIRQKEDGTYSTINAFLTDKMLAKHLDGSETLGVFSGELFTSFICFDVDKGKKPTVKLLEVLKSMYGFSDDEILTSFSGNKGYHVELFYEEPVAVDKAKAFYKGVLAKAELSPKEVEFRPTPKQAVKLPLSYHRGTGKLCHIVSNKTLRPVSSKSTETIKLIRHDEAWEYKLVASVETVFDGLNFDLPVNYRARCERMLTENSILYPNSRHNATILLLNFLTHEGYSKDEAIALTKSVVRQSRSLIQSDMDFALAEVERLYDYAAKYRFDLTVEQVVRIYKSEIEYILSQYSELKHQRALFSLLVHSGRWANQKGIFYVSLKQLAAMGNDDNASRLSGTLRELREVQIVEKRKMLPNKYMLNIPVEKQGLYVELTALSKVSFEETLTHLFERKELKKFLTRRQVERVFKYSS